MPIPLLAGIAAGQSIANFTSQMLTNQTNKKLTEKMYRLQRADALSDWAMQNEYNSPKAQMERLREAKLNPNLVYGHGADVTAPPVRSSSPQSIQFDAPEVNTAGVQSGLLAHADLRLKDATTDNVTAQQHVIENEALLKEAQINQTIANTDQSKFDLAQKMRLKDISFEAAQLHNEKTKADIAYTLDENDRAAIRNTYNIKEAVERILTSRLQRQATEQGIRLTKEQIKEVRSRIDNLDKDGQLKQLEINLKKRGITWSDPIYLRAVGQIVRDLQIGKSLRNYQDKVGHYRDSVLHSRGSLDSTRWEMQRRNWN